MDIRDGFILQRHSNRCMDKLILVDEKDRKVGVEDKLQAHKTGALHRAFSVYIFNSENELLVQKRADGKYHNPGMWSNTCCSHPKPGEDVEEAAKRRLDEEMGFKTDLEKLDEFIYSADFDNGLMENEYLHVYRGEYEGEVQPYPLEVSDYKWMSLDALEKDINENPEDYTYWFRYTLKRVFL